MWLSHLHRAQAFACSRSFAVCGTPPLKRVMASFCSADDSVWNDNGLLSGSFEVEADAVFRTSNCNESRINPWVTEAATIEGLQQQQQQQGVIEGTVKSGVSGRDHFRKRGQSELSMTSEGVASNAQMLPKQPQMDIDSQQSKRIFHGLEGEYMAALRGNHSEAWQAMNKSMADKRLGAPHHTGVGRAFVSAIDSSNDGSQMRAGTTAQANGACYRCGQEGHWVKDCPMASFGKVPIGGSENLDSGEAIPEKNCPCGAGSCVVRTANTEKNRGRKFYRCPKRQEEGGCDFFEWCDVASAASGVSGTRIKASVPELKCPCGAGLCMVRTAGTEKNMGRQFYTCPKNLGEGGCDFFKWCDETNDTGISSTGYTRKVAEGSLSSGNSTGVHLHCFKCGMDGHWPKDCPGLFSVKPVATSNDLPYTYKWGTGYSGISSSSTCFKCGQTGHWSKECPRSNPGSTFPLDSSNVAVSGNCFKCGGAGHWAANCPGGSSSSRPIYGSKEGSGFEGGSSTGSCYKCGGKGHWANNCTGSGKGNKGRSTYWMN